ncbi:hypothetical protein D3C85_1633770 [compost metagenome]
MLTVGAGVGLKEVPVKTGLPPVTVVYHLSSLPAEGAIAVSTAGLPEHIEMFCVAGELKVGLAGVT